MEKMTKVRVIFEFETAAYNDIPARAEQKIIDFATSGDSLKDVADIYSKDKGKPWLKW